jgi:hypothetical protein
MARTVGISELKAHCLRLVDEVARLRGTVLGGDRVEDFETGVVWEATRR